MTDRLAAMSARELQGLLKLRPEVALPPTPRDLAEVAARLDAFGSIVALFPTLSLPCLQAAQAVAAIDADCTVARLTALLDSGERTPAEHVAAVLQVLKELAAAGLVLASDDGRIERPSGLGELIEEPLGLGKPVRTLLRKHTAAQLRQIVHTLGGRPSGKDRAGALEGVLRLLSDPEFVRNLVASQPPEIGTFIMDFASGEATDAFGGTTFGNFGRYDMVRFNREQEALKWASQRGLVVVGQYGFNYEMPCEVALALLGPDLRAPFMPEAPPLAVRPVDSGRVAGYSAAAATDFADHALVILDRLALAPLVRLKAGGVGVRELTKLAKATQCDMATARLVLELAMSAGLVGATASGFTVSRDFGPWRDSDPAERLVVLLRAWWSYGGVASRGTEVGGGTRPALLDPQQCGECQRARTVVLSTLAEAGGAVTAEELVARARWVAPYAHLGDAPGDGPGSADVDLFAGLWRELHLLGLVAEGAVTELGRTAAARDWATAAQVLAAAMPPAADHALFGADLTAYVAGAPTSAVSALLDSVADREGRGGAVAWRFSSASVRRAMDAGATAAWLVGELTAIATGELPQPLRYLIEEVGQRHGTLRVSAAVSVIRSDDAPLLAQVVADRKLRSLGLRSVAPTAATSKESPEALIATLRAAGYLPMPGEDDEPGSTDARGSEPRSGAQAAGPASGGRPMAAAGRALKPGSTKESEAIAAAEVEARLASLAEHLSAVGRSAPQSRPPAAVPPPTPAPEATLLLPFDYTLDDAEQRLAEMAPGLTLDELLLLNGALQGDDTVHLTVQGKSGRVVGRTVSMLVLDRDTILGWSESTNRPETFELSRILSVTQAWDI